MEKKEHHTEDTVESTEVHHEVKEAHHKKSNDIRINKKVILAVLLVLLVMSVAYLARPMIFAASVDGAFITRMTVMHALEEASGKAYIETLITEKLILNEGKKMGIVVSSEDVAKEIARIETGLAAQGATMDMLLASQNITLENLQRQLSLKKILEELLAEKINVTEEEVNAYFTEAKLDAASRDNPEIRAGIVEQLKGQKLNTEAGAYIEELRSKANIMFYGNYAVAPVVPPAE